jgi:membrane associated rhomboid family serine protease
VTDTATCYRHPDRPTRLACSNCGRPICVDCSIDSAVGQKCPECAAPEGRHRVITRSEIRRTSQAVTPVTWVLIAINVIVFFIGEVDPELGRRLFVDGAFHPVLASQGEWWRAITSMFLHGSFTHILFNMWALYLFGPALERRFGSASFLALYIACGIGGSALYHVLGRPSFAVGASGAIFGLMGGLLAASYRQRHTPAGRAVFGQLTFLLAINLLIPFVVPNVAWEAHMGGLAAGVLITSAWDRLPVHGPGSTARRVGVAAAVALVGMAFVLIV